MLSVAVKITPSSQTLILAGERRGSSNPTGATSASKAGATGSRLSRLTIVATQPDTSVVYLRADYSPDGGDAIGGSITYGGPSSGTAITARAQTSNAVGSAPRALANPSYPVTSSHTGAANVSRTSSSSFLNLKPTEQYAFTQRILNTGPVVQYINAYA
jgi:hypothetical protein